MRVFIRPNDGGDLVPIKDDWVRDSLTLNNMIQDTDDQSEDLIIPLNLSSEEANSPIIIGDFLELNYMNEADELLMELDENGDKLSDRELYILYNANPQELKSLSSLNRYRRLAVGYRVYHLKPFDLILFNQLASDRPSGEQITRRILDKIDEGLSPNMFDSLVDQLYNQDVNLDIVALIQAGVRLGLVNMVEGLELYIQRGEPIMDIIQILLEDYNGQSIHLLYNLFVKYNMTTFRGLLPRYFPIDSGYQLDLNNSEIDRSEVLQALIDYEVDSAYLSYLIIQSIRIDINIYKYLAKSGVGLLVTYLLHEDDPVEALSEIDQNNIQFILDTRYTNDDTIEYMIDDNEMRLFLIDNLDIVSYVNIFDRLYSNENNVWEELLDSAPESYIPYLLYMMEDVPDRYGDIEPLPLPDQSLERVIESDDLDTFLVMENEVRHDSADVEFTLSEIISNRVIERIFSNRQVGLVENHLIIELVGDIDEDEFLDYRYKVELITYLNDYTLKRLKEIRSIKEVVDDMYQ